MVVEKVWGGSVESPSVVGVVRLQAAEFKFANKNETEMSQKMTVFVKATVEFDFSELDLILKFIFQKWDENDKWANYEPIMSQ